MTLAWILERLMAPAITTGVSDKEFDVVSQSAHVWSAGWIVFVFALWTSPWWGLVAVLSFAGIKEGWYDQQYETAEVRGSNLRDFAFYLLGAIVTALLLTLVRR